MRSVSRNKTETKIKESCWLGHEETVHSRGEERRGYFVRSDKHGGADRVATDSNHPKMILVSPDASVLSEISARMRDPRLR